MKFNNDFYPSLTTIADPKVWTEWIPDSLSTILRALIPPELKSSSIGQTIVHASKSPSVISLMLFELGVTLDLSFGSKWLLVELA